MDKIKRKAAFPLAAAMLLSAVFSFSFFSPHLGYVLAQDNLEFARYNLGAIYPGKIIEKKFEFNGRIRKAISLCECLKFKTYKKNDSPEEIYILDVEFDPDNYRGKSEVEEDIFIMYEENSVLKLRIKGNIIEDKSE